MSDPLESTPGRSPWICHVCDYISDTEENRTCTQCYRVTCSLHLQKVSVYNKKIGLYELADVCIYCTPDE